MNCSTKTGEIRYAQAMLSVNSDELYDFMEEVLGTLRVSQLEPAARAALEIAALKRFRTIDN